jgi:hypothetical protein
MKGVATMAATSSATPTHKGRGFFSPLMTPPL